MPHRGDVQGSGVDTSAHTPNVTRDIMIDLSTGYLDPLLLHQIRAAEHEQRIEAVRRARERAARLRPDLHPPERRRTAFRRDA